MFWKKCFLPLVLALYTSCVWVWVMHGAADVCHAFSQSVNWIFFCGFRRRLLMLHEIQLDIAPAAETWVFLQDLRPNSRPSQQTCKTKTNGRHENISQATTVQTWKGKTTFVTRKSADQKEKRKHVSSDRRCRTTPSEDRHLQLSMNVLRLEVLAWFRIQVRGNPGGTNTRFIRKCSTILKA